MSLIPGFSPVAEERPRRSWRRRLLYSLLLIGAIFSALIGWAYWRGNKVISEAIAEVERIDPHWRIHDLESQRIAIPDSANSAIFIDRGKKLVDNTVRNQQAENDSSSSLEDIRKFPNAKLNDQQKAIVAALLKPYKPAFIEWKKVDTMPMGRFPIKYSPDFIGTLLPGVQSARECANAFRYDVWDRAAAGDRTGAVQSMKCLLNSGRAIGDEPFLISLLVRIAIHAIATNSLEELLAQMQLEESDLTALQNSLEDDANMQLLTKACQGERAGSFETFEHIKKNRQYVPALTGMVGGPASQWRVFDYLMMVLPGSVSKHQADCLRFTNQAVQVSKLPVEQHADGFAELEKEMPKLSFLARMLAPSMSKVAQAHTRWQAQVRCSIVAIAAERYRVKHGKWPEDLNTLVTEKLLTQNVLDPFDGKTMRWVVVPEGRLVYSVGPDRTDNNGYINYDNFLKAGSDLGFRLFDWDKRATAPRPPKSKDPESDNPEAGPS